jgi:hypothetical protein
VKSDSFLGLRRFGASALLAAVLTVASFMSGHPLLTGAASAAPAPKIQICHIPPGNPANWHTITISEKALGAHLKHGDLPGAPYYGAQVAISVGSHTVQAPNPVGLYVYGFAPYMSYGYSGGFSSVP